MCFLLFPNHSTVSYQFFSCPTFFFLLLCLFFKKISVAYYPNILGLDKKHVRLPSRNIMRMCAALLSPLSFVLGKESTFLLEVEGRDVISLWTWQKLSGRNKSENTSVKAAVGTNTAVMQSNAHLLRSKPHWSVVDITPILSMSQIVIVECFLHTTFPLQVMLRFHSDLKVLLGVPSEWFIYLFIQIYTQPFSHNWDSKWLTRYQYNKWINIILI